MSVYTFGTETMQMSWFFSLIFRCIYFVNLSMLSCTAASPSYKSFHAIRIREYDGRKVQQSQIHMFTNVTKIDCCAACSREKYCQSFHFYPDGPTCVTLRERFEHVTVTSSTVYGYQLFQTDKPLATDGTDCELDVDCKSLSNSHCHNGSCTCDVGHRLDGSTCRNYTVACDSSPGYTWDVDTDMCYRIEAKDRRTWADAEGICTVNKGHLIKPDTEKKNNKLKTLLEPTRTCFWVGVRNNPYAAEWQWLDQTAVTSPPWAPGEPSGDGRCVLVSRSTQYMWNDIPCSSDAHYICEIPLN